MKKKELIKTILIIIMVFGIVGLSFIIKYQSKITAEELINVEEYLSYKKSFGEILEIHEMKYDGEIIGLYRYENDSGENFNIIYEHKEEGWYFVGSSPTINTYITKYIKTDSGTVYEISNERIK